ncbi:hypothetical protein [Kitasatospora sp. NPDC059599]|uniref:hypothetical protein n=1 Tax=Kitasatospora sp. NPDC059599 TaxID=3346880 RepID=UPI0036843CFA
MSQLPLLPRLVVIPVFEGIDALDVTGPDEMLAFATRLLPPGSAGYDVRFRVEGGAGGGVLGHPAARRRAAARDAGATRHPGLATRYDKSPESYTAGLHLRVLIM